MAIVFFDLDGTLLSGGKPAKGAIKAIEALKANNHTVAIATGRSPIVMYEIEKDLGIDYLVLANGSLVIHNDKVIYDRRFSNSLIKRIMEFSDKKNTDLVIEYIDEYIAYRKNTESVDGFADIFNIKRPKVDKTFYPDRAVYTMVIFDKDLIEEYRKEFPELVFNKANAFGYDVNLKGNLKAEGVEQLIKYLDFDYNDTYAFGDNNNDIQMIKAVKHGVAMGNASNKLKSVADYVTTDVNDYGIMNALIYYKLV